MITSSNKFMGFEGVGLRELQVFQSVAFYHGDSAKAA